MILQSPTIVLKSFPYGDTSLISRCLTREMGKIGVIVRGARRKKNPMGAYFQPMSYLDLMFYYKQTRDLQTVSKASFSELWLNIQNHLKPMSIGLSILEMTERAITDHDPHPELFDELVTCLRALDAQSFPVNIVYWYYEMQLLTQLGFKPDLSLNDFPGMNLPDPNSGPNSKIILTKLQTSRLSSLPNFTVTQKDKTIVSQYLLAQIHYHFEEIKSLKSLDVLKKILL